MSSQIFRATVVYNFIRLTKSLAPSHVGKSLPVKFLKYFVNASSICQVPRLIKNISVNMSCYKFNNAYASYGLNNSFFICYMFCKS